MKAEDVSGVQRMYAERIEMERRVKADNAQWWSGIYDRISNRTAGFKGSTA